MSTFDNLPNISFAVKDTSIIEEEIIKAFEDSTGREIFPADPLRLLILTFAKQISLQRSNIDYSAKQNLLKYATEGYIENIGALLGVTRLKPLVAITTLRFTISQSLPNDLIIQKGTRVASGNRINFETAYVSKIAHGEISVDIDAVCTEIGEIGNGFLPGELNRIVDPFPFFKSVENITITQGGADLEDIERFRERIRESPESFSTAGPSGAYEFWAKTASQIIVDVSVSSPSPGVVQIIPLMKNGEIPTQDILDLVYKECNDDSRRPLTDMVVVKAPEIINYNLELIYYINRSDAAMGLNIQNRVNIAMENFINWQKEVLGRDINPSRLTGMIVEAGAKRVEIVSPIFIPTSNYQVAIVKEVLVTYGGLEND